jgi:hypothetical protein
MSEIPMTNGEHVTHIPCIESHDFFGHGPILEHKYYEMSSVFTPENLLREARRQKGLAYGTVPTMCVLDPDGDLVDHLHATLRMKRHPTWTSLRIMASSLE